MLWEMITSAIPVGDLLKWVGIAAGGVFLWFARGSQVEDRIRAEQAEDRAEALVEKSKHQREVGSLSNEDLADELLSTGGGRG